MSESGVYRHQILTIKVDPCTVRVKDGNIYKCFGGNFGLWEINVNRDTTFWLETRMSWYSTIRRQKTWTKILFIRKHIEDCSYDLFQLVQLVFGTEKCFKIFSTDISCDLIIQIQVINLNLLEVVDRGNHVKASLQTSGWIWLTYPMASGACKRVFSRSRGWNKMVEHVPLRDPAKNDLNTGDWNTYKEIY